MDMNESEVIQMMRKQMEGLFPKVCPCCNRRFATLREFILTTDRLEPVTSFDMDLAHLDLSEPLGTVAMSNCPCGSTLALTTKGLPSSKYLQFLEWIKIEMVQRRVSQEALLGYLRDEIRKQILVEPDKGDSRKQD